MLERTHAYEVGGQLDSIRTARTALFLMDLLRRGIPDGDYLNVSRFVDGSPVSICVGTAQLPSAARWIGESDTDTYICLGLLSERLPPKLRVAERRVSAVLGFSMDFDCVMPYRKHGNLFEHPDAALEAIKALPVQPRMVIQTGGGLQPVWLFSEPVFTSTDDERKAMKARSTKLQTAVRRIVYDRHRVVLDSTADLARLVRAPGSQSHKTHPPIDVGVIFDTGAYL